MGSPICENFIRMRDIRGFYVNLQNKRKSMIPFKSIRGIYFSPTGTTRAVTEFVIQQLASRWGLPYSITSYTLPTEREQWKPLAENELVVWGTPVYAGRIPNKTLDFVKEHLQCPGAKFIALAVYGGRNYDDTLAELCQIATEGGLTPIGATAVVARHTFSTTLNAGRPNAEDYKRLERFCQDIDPECSVPINVPGNPHPEKYYTPLKEDGTPAKFLKAKPVTDLQRCNGCGTCVKVCPMGSRALEADKATTPGICIKCQACIKSCPQEALRFTDEEFLSHVKMLERTVK